ncbi:hypothetical protein SESBI_19659 [Sesbania bispinosa]|nr:hypothetical protein SESBI_19659 [Sesbania bispinosa]
MKALKSYVKDLDFKAIRVFLAKVSETKENGSLSSELTISLYELLARVHGVKIVPLIDNIMESVVQTLGSSAGSFPLHQACSKESLASGPALCLKALMDLDNWRFASDEMVNMVCQNVAVALEGKSSQREI